MWLAPVPFLIAGASKAAPIGTAITFQGRLVKDGTPVSSAPPHCDFTVGLWDADVSGNQKGNSPQAVNGVEVADGLFGVTIDFGAGAFDGTARWLEVTVQCPGDAMPTTLAPRQELKPAPYALALPGLYTQQNTACPNLIGGYHANFVTAGVTGATISGGGLVGNTNRVTDLFGTVGGGYNNQSGDGAGSLVDNGYATVCGGINNWAAGHTSVVSGGNGNAANGGGSAVGGGGNNQAAGQTSAIAGGTGNSALETHSAIGGGQANVTSGYASTVPGGVLNQAGGDYSFAAGRRAKVRTAAQVGGGDLQGDEGTFIWADNSVDADFTSTASDQFLVRAAGGVGIATTAPDAQLHVFGSTDASLSDGTGVLVVGDKDGLNLVADGDEIIARNNASPGTLLLNNGSGNVGILRASASHPLHVGTNNTNGNGAHLTAGGTWTNGSDRNTKENFRPLDAQSILHKVAKLPVTEWNYKGETNGERHVGPTAQDFRAAFGLGHDDRYITTIDADGVALAAIQGLHQIVQEKDCEIAELREREMTKDQRIENLEARLARIEAILHNQGSSNGEGQ
jgi:hypothetical protein